MHQNAPKMHQMHQNVAAATEASFVALNRSTVPSAPSARFTHPPASPGAANAPEPTCSQPNQSPLHQSLPPSLPRPPAELHHFLHFPSLHSSQTEHIQPCTRKLCSTSAGFTSIRPSASATILFAYFIMSSPWKKQPEDVVDSVLKRAEVSKVSEGMHDAIFNPPSHGATASYRHKDVEQEHEMLTYALFCP